MLRLPPFKPDLRTSDTGLVFYLSVHRMMWGLIERYTMYLDKRSALQLLGYPEGYFDNNCPACEAMRSHGVVDCDKCPLDWGHYVCCMSKDPEYLSPFEIYVLSMHRGSIDEARRAASELRDLPLKRTAFEMYYIR